uniref:DUF7342 family protein n=1 Tax=Halomarina oriensis TaxID=671145 RepID=UPI001E59F241|nr:hypothetical protein [Halomarina oriensis]
MEVLSEPATPDEIAERADVPVDAAEVELEQLERGDWVLESTIDGATAYDLNPVRLFLDEMTSLIEERPKKNWRESVLSCGKRGRI